LCIKQGDVKYALASVKKSHVVALMPMYARRNCMPIKALMPQAGFQKGCINFSIAAEYRLNSKTLIQTAQRLT